MESILLCSWTWIKKIIDNASSPHPHPLAPAVSPQTPISSSSWFSPQCLFTPHPPLLRGRLIHQALLSLITSPFLPYCFCLLANRRFVLSLPRACNQELFPLNDRQYSCTQQPSERYVPDVNSFDAREENNSRYLSLRLYSSVYNPMQ